MYVTSIPGLGGGAGYLMFWMSGLVAMALHVVAWERARTHGA